MKYDVIIIGGGIIGLATALELSKANAALKVAVLEKEPEIARHQSGNNSGVIHSGIYYKPGSLKASNCIEGRKKLLQFCDENNIPYELCGKIIVASNQKEIPALDALYQRGLDNGLEGLKRLPSSEIKAYEPSATGAVAIFVPQTGIVDFAQVSRAFARLFENNGGRVFLNKKVTNINRKSDISEIVTTTESFEAKLVINCAGLYSDKIALINRPKLEVRIVPFRGEYYKLKPHASSLIKNLIYPVPDAKFPFLGAHFTRRITGAVEAGPNAVFAFKREGYKFSHFNVKEFLQSLFWPGFLKMSRKHWQTGVGEFHRSLSKSAFVRALQKLVPEITESDLEAGGAGVRAQAVDRNGKLVDDFVILEDEYQIDVINAPSPAATASLAIGQEIAQKALARL